MIALFSGCRFSSVSNCPPDAQAALKGSPAHHKLRGTVDFYQRKDGVLLVAEVWGLPAPVTSCAVPIFALHIHEGGSCTGTAEDPFANAGAHYNPELCPHPAHAGDLPPLFGNRGYAFLAVFTNRFSVNEVLGRTVIIHSEPDDFKTQPAGNAGDKIACGIIRSLGKRPH